MLRFKVLILSLVLTVVPIIAIAVNSEGTMSDGSKGLHRVMERSTQMMPQMEMSGDVDKDFAQMMADHHRTAIEMAKIEAEHGKDKELKQLAQKIISTQKEEISILEKHSAASH